jgi:CsoR family transcriptional regulator, copper-sensing transcriptional repressor
MLPDKKSAVSDPPSSRATSRVSARMVEGDKYCVDVLNQTYAVRRAIEKLEGLMLDNHLYTCVIESVRDGRDHQVISELLDLYELAKK